MSTGRSSAGLSPALLLPHLQEVCGDGDQRSLAQYAWGYTEGDVVFAAVELAHRYGVDLPQRPATWYTKQTRQEPVRDAIDRARFDHLRRRLFRAFFDVLHGGLEEFKEREAEATILWDATEPLARMMVERLRGAGR